MRGKPGAADPRGAAAETLTMVVELQVPELLGVLLLDTAGGTSGPWLLSA